MALSRSASSLRALTRSLTLPASFSRAAIASSSSSSSRTFTSSTPFYKKRKVAVPQAEPEQAASSPPSSGGRHERTKQVTGGKQKHGKGAQKQAPASVEEFDPLDFTALHEAIAPIDAHFKSQLQSLLHGGRFNPEVLGALPVPVKDDTGETATFPLRELAQIVPRGRTHVSLLLNDAAYHKPILSAVQSSPDFNQQPQKSEDNDLELVMRVEMERKEEVVKRVKEVGQQWRERVRSARGKFEKGIKDKAKKGVVLPDDLKRVEKEVQKVQDGKMKEVEEEEKRAVKMLQK